MTIGLPPPRGGIWSFLYSVAAVVFGSLGVFCWPDMLLIRPSVAASFLSRLRGLF